MKIEVLGPGCPNCEKLGERVRTAARELGLDFEYFKVTDIQKITGYGVMMTPALVVDGQVKLSGKVASVDEIKKILSDA